jgi:hypothetical protein
LLIDAEQTREGREIRARLAHGSIRATVTRTGRQTS